MYISNGSYYTKIKMINKTDLFNKMSNIKISYQTNSAHYSKNLAIRQTLTRYFILFLYWISWTRDTSHTAVQWVVVILIKQFILCGCELSVTMWMCGCEFSVTMWMCLMQCMSPKPKKQCLWSITNVLMSPITLKTFVHIFFNVTYCYLLHAN